jgi:hypothetical protein
VDKVASVTRRFNLGRTLTLSEKVEAESGAVVAARVLNDKNTYNQLEDVHGRLSVVQSGDRIVGALGHRNALHGYEGVLPTKVAAGSRLNLLNLGGVIGECVSHNPDVGPPFEVEILGQVLVFPEFQSRVGKPANIVQCALSPSEGHGSVPVIYIAGTCMNSGKTAAACTIIRKLCQAGYRVGGAKLTGVSLIRDILAMRDYGAEWSYDFTDTGVVSSTAETSTKTARILFDELRSKGAQLIVAETGDGIMGEYGVQAILGDKDLMSRSAAFVLCANDPAGVAGAVRELDERYGIRADVVAGPATDNQVGTRFIEREFHIPGVNARTRADALGELILDKVRPRQAVRP